MKEHMFGSLLKRSLFKLIIHPIVYVAGILFVFSVNFAFFYLGGFFNLDTATVEARHFFSIIPYVSFLVIPAIATASDDWRKTNGECLPVSDTLLFVTKAFSVFVIYAAFLLCIVPSCIILNRFGDIRLSQVISGFLCMALFGMCISCFCCYATDCLANKTASFFLSAVVVLLASTCHLLPQYVKLPSFLQSLLTSVSVAWHTDAAGKGIIDTKDIMFFVTLSATFTWLAVIKRESLKKRKQYLYSFLVICAGILTISASSLYYMRFDITEEKQFSLSDTGKKIIESAEAPLSITYYLSPELEPLYPQVRDVKDYLNTLSSENENISVLTVNPSDLESKKRLENLGIISQQLQTTQENKTSYISVYSSLLFEYGNNAAVIPFVLSTSSLEYDILMRIRALTTGMTTTVLIYTGNGLNTDDDYPYLKPWLQSSGFVCYDIAPEELYSYKAASDTILLVLGSSESTQSDAAAIEAWMLNGGNIFFAVSPNRTDIKGTWQTKHTGTDPVIEMLDFWGIGIDSGLCADTSCYTIRMYSSSGSDAKYIDYPYWIYADYTNNIITDSLQPLVMYWTSPLYFASKQDVTVRPLVQTTENAWLLYPDDTEESYITDPFQIQYLEKDKKTIGQYVLAASIEGKISGCYDTRKSSDVRIIIAGDQYFLSSVIENTNSLYTNMDFLLSSVLWLNNDEDMIAIKNKGTINTTPYKTKTEAEFSSNIAIVKAVCLVIMPSLFPMMYALVYVIRKRQIKKQVAGK